MSDPTPDERAATRELAARIVEAARDDKEMPLPLMYESHDYVLRAEQDDVEQLALRLATEIEALANERDEARNQFRSAARLLAKAMLGGNITSTDTGLASTLFKLAEIEP